MMKRDPPFFFLYETLLTVATPFSPQTRLQFKSPTGRALYASPIDVFRRAYAKQGFAGLYAGVEGQLLKGFVNEGLKLLIKER